MENKGNNNNGSGMSVASLTLGIISICSALFWYISLTTGVLAIVFGAKAIKASGKRLGKAGLVTGIIGLALTVFIYVSLILIIILARSY